MVYRRRIEVVNRAQKPTYVFCRLTLQYRICDCIPMFYPLIVYNASNQYCLYHDIHSQVDDGLAWYDILLHQNQDMHNIETNTSHMINVLDPTRF